MGGSKYHYKRGSRIFCQRGSNFDNFFFVLLFLVDEWWEDPNTTISADTECFCLRGSNFDNVVFFLLFFLADEWWEEQNAIIKGPSSAHQRNAFWRFAGVLMIAQH